MTFTIVADEKVPHVREALGGLGTLIPVTAAEIPRWIERADALVVRSVTRVDGALVDGTRVRWVGSATAGLDHIDCLDLERRGIQVEHAPGANAQAVTEYVVAAVALAITRGAVPEFGDEAWWIPTGPQWGIVGFGQIGRRLTRVLRRLGCRVQVCDPPLAHLVRTHQDPGGPWPLMAMQEDYYPLDELLAGCDVVTLHVPLTVEGFAPTVHLLDSKRIRRCRTPLLVVNTSRGPVVAGEAVHASSAVSWILDVWEHEPAVDASLLTEDRLVVATPHVAGYTREAKVMATRMLHAALCRFLQVAPSWEGPGAVEPSVALVSPQAPSGPSEALARILDQVVGLTAMDRAMRRLVGLSESERSEAFERLRAPQRRELSAYRLEQETNVAKPIRRMLAALGMP